MGERCFTAKPGGISIRVKKGEKRKKKDTQPFHFFRTSWWAGQTLHVPSVFPRQLAFTCTLRLKTQVKVSLYIYIYLYIFICIYIYIYIKGKVTEDPSGFSCHGQVTFPRGRAEGDQLTTPVLSRRAPRGAGTCPCHPVPFSGSAGGATGVVSAHFLHCQGP